MLERTGNGYLVEFIANKRMKAVGLESPFKGGSDPLPHGFQVQKYKWPHKKRK